MARDELGYLGQQFTAVVVTVGGMLTMMIVCCGNVSARADAWGKVKVWVRLPPRRIAFGGSRRWAKLIITLITIRGETGRRRCERRG